MTNSAQTRAWLLVGRCFSTAGAGLGADTGGRGHLYNFQCVPCPVGSEDCKFAFNLKVFLICPHDCSSQRGLSLVVASDFLSDLGSKKPAFWVVVVLSLSFLTNSDAQLEVWYRWMSVLGPPCSVPSPGNKLSPALKRVLVRQTLFSFPRLSTDSG